MIKQTNFARLTVKLVFFFLMIFTLSLSAQNNFNVYQCQTQDEAIAIVDSVLLGNVDDVFKKNITITGDPRAVGYYTNGYIFGFAESSGIAMSTGFAGSLSESNTCSDANANSGTNGGYDPDLDSMTNLSINDACVIEFDLMLFNDSVFLSYVFGSEEYHDYVGSQFNDVFGFLMSGPGVDGPYTNDAINIAKVPDTQNPVSINNVNCGAEHAFCTPPPGNGDNCEFLHDNTNQGSSSFNQCALDAYTTPFITQEAIESYEWYHFKLAIGDAGDGLFDSGVLLEKGSIVSIPVPTMDMVECNDESEAIQYIDEVLLSKVSVENKANISFSGDAKALGYFTNTEFLNLDENEGLLFTNGYAGNVNQPNQCDTPANLNTDNDGLEKDADIELLADGSDVGDVSIIEFDFRASSETMTMNYVFASEEYHDMINDGFHDVFGIFLSGPGIEGEYSNNAVNIATIPGGDIPVNSSTINFGVGGETCAGKPDGCTNCEYLIDNSQKPDSAFFAMAYDGYTVPMFANHQVVTGEWYHVKIAIADALLEDFDSGIFLSGGSLISDSLMTSVDTRTKFENILLRPNPANNYVEIQNKGKEPILSFAIYDINGRLLVNEPYTENKISLVGLPKGVLFLELSIGSDKTRHKLIHN